MRFVYLFVLVVLINISAFAKGVSMQPGQKFNYRYALYEKSDSLSEKMSEGITIMQINMEVLEKTANGYTMKATMPIDVEYDRNKKHNTWEALGQYDKELISEQHTSEEERYLYAGKEVTFKMSESGRLTDLVVVKQKDSPNSTDIFKPAYFNLFTKIFVQTPEKIKPGTCIQYQSMIFTISNVKDNYAIAKHKNESGFYQIMFDIHTGLLLESVVQGTQEISKNPYAITSNDFPFNHKKGSNHIMERINRVNVQTEQFKCQYSLNNIDKDTTFAQTNVTIKGKVINSGSDKPITLTWYKRKPAAYDSHVLLCDLAKDNTFEFRLNINDILKVQLNHGKKFSFMILPGDEMDITLDLKDFPNNVVCKGINKGSIKYFLKKQTFDNKEELTQPHIFDKVKNLYVEKTPQEFEIELLGDLDKKQQFLAKNKHLLAPEIYLAEYWSNHAMIITFLMHYGLYQKTYRKKAGLEPYEEPVGGFFNFSKTIHPNNNMMRFSDNYESFIRNYVFFELKDEFNRIAGTGSVVPKSFHDEIAFSNYGLARSFFTGYARHVLEYTVIVDAMKRANWETFSQLYHRFVLEYPNSSKTKLLVEAYEKTKLVRPGQFAYDFKLTDTVGNLVKLSDFRGKGVYIDFWSGPYAGENNGFEKYTHEFMDKFKDDNIVFVYITQKSGLETIKKQAKESNYKGVILLATNEQRKQLWNKYQFDVRPFFCIINPEGRIYKRFAESPSQIVHNKNILLDALQPQRRVSDSKKMIFLLKVISLSLAGLLLATLIIWLLYRQRAVRRAKAFKLKNKVQELELTAIRAQMNPHFMFNCLNSIQNLIQKGKADEANDYLSKFAMLIRMILKFSDKKEIALSEEIEMINHYVHLEQLRFNLNYQLNIATEIDVYTVFIPPLLLQPLIENSIIHGLANKKGDRTLAIKIEAHGMGVHIIIEDNGIGRMAAAKLPKTSSGKGIAFSKERIGILAEQFGEEYTMNIIDLSDANNQPAGTRIEIYLPE